MQYAVLVVIVLICAVMPVHAQFEGVVESKNLTTDEMGDARQFTITMWIKKDRIRVQSSAVGTTPATTMIYRIDKKVTWMLNDEDKTYFEILRRDDERGKNMPPVPSEKAAVVRTGKTKKILGYPCEQVLLKRADQETEIWGTKSLPQLAATTSRVLGETEQEEGEAWQSELKNLGLYPLAASSRVEGKVVEAQEVTRIEQHDVPGEMFELPTGYKKQDIGETQEAK